MTVLPLPANLTYKNRELHWTLYTKPGFRCSAVAEVREARKPGGKVKVRRYAVQEKVSTIRGQRVFSLSKPLSTGQPAHQCCLERSGQWRCQCEAADAGKECVHTQLLSAALKAGCLPCPASG